MVLRETFNNKKKDLPSIYDFLPNGRSFFPQVHIKTKITLMGRPFFLRNRLRPKLPSRGGYFSEGLLAPKLLTPASPTHLLKCCSSSGFLILGFLVGVRGSVLAGDIYFVD